MYRCLFLFKVVFTVITCGSLFATAFSPRPYIHNRVSSTPQTYLKERSNDVKFEDNAGNSKAGSFWSRRETLEKSAILFANVILSCSSKALAFPNKISSQYDDRPKQRGSKACLHCPKDLGVAIRKDLAEKEFLGLKQCGPAPNCFCSTDIDDPEHNIPYWKWPKTLSSRQDAFQQLYEVLKAYPPGQSNIDGGGFDIVSFDPRTGYIYVQYESLKNGYIDDLEIAAIENDSVDNSNVVHVRSSSRLGYLDFGVNSKRLNYLAKELREKGWDAPGVDLNTHKGYAEENGLNKYSG